MENEKYIKFSLTKQKDINSSPIVYELGNKKNEKTLLGAIDFLQPCKTCKETILCHGHNAVFNINQTLFKPVFKKLVVFLKLICPKCKLIQNESLVNFFSKLEKKKITNEDRKEFFILYNEVIKNTKYNLKKCVYNTCNSVVSPLQYKNNSFLYKDDKILKELSNEEIYKILCNLPKIFKKLISKNFEPENIFFHKALMIPSNYIRVPNVYEGIVFDFLNSDLTNIMKILNTNSSDSTKKAQKILDIIDNGSNLNPYSNNKKLNLDILTSGNDKDSYLRNNINGKRIVGTSRAVISPSTKIPIGNIEVSEYILNVLTDIICYNRLTKNYINDGLIQKNNNFINYIKKNDSEICYKIYDLKYIKKNTIIPTYGDKIEIKKEKGSYITYCRPPSLHYWNIQSAEIIPTKNYTTNIPTAVCTSFNADFDGDEMTNYNFNNTSSNIELGLLMNSKNLLKHPLTGNIMFGLIQDQLLGFNLLLQEKNITLHETFLIFDKYAFLIKDIKDSYEGKELISYLIPENFSYKNIFKNGKIIVDELHIKYLTPNSVLSIFNLFSHNYKIECALELIDLFKNIIQNYIKYFGISVSLKDIVPNKNILKNINYELKSKIEKINKEIIVFEKKIKNNNELLLDFNEFIDLKLKKIDILNVEMNEVLLKNLKYYDNNNIFFKCYKIGYKLNNNDLMNILSHIGQKISKNMLYMFLPKINGKTSLYSLKNDLSIEDTGFITNSIINGVSYGEYVSILKNESLPQIVDVTSGTSETGFMGKKIIKFASEMFINNDKFCVNNKNIINFNPNFYKVSMKDIIKIKIILPNKNMLWYENILKLFNKEIKIFVLQKSLNNLYIIIEELNFYLNLESEIRTYSYQNKEIINEELKYEYIIETCKYIKDKYFFKLNNISIIIYILLIYFDPSGFIFKDFEDYENIKKNLNKNLFDILINKIYFKLDYSLSTATSFGYLIGNTIQEKFTQQSLSSFHSSTKTGSNVKKASTEEFKQLLEMYKKNKEDIISCYSYDIEILKEIKNKFEYVCLKNLCNKIDIIEENKEKEYVVYNIKTVFDLLKKKDLDIKYLYLMIKKYCERCDILNSFEILINLYNSKTIDIYLKVEFKGNEYDFDIKKHYFKLSLLDGISKGKLLNNNLFIDKLENTILDEEGNIIKKDYYELKFFLETIEELEFIDTTKLETIHLTPWLLYFSAGIEFMKISTLGKSINVLGDYIFINSLKHFFDLKFNQKKPLSIKMLNDKNQIIKLANHGNSDIFAKSAFNNKIDKCNDVYSSLFVCQRPVLGTNYFNFMLDPNLFDILKVEKEKTDYVKKEDKIITMF